MIRTESTETGVKIGMAGSISDLIFEATIALKDILKHIPKEQRAVYMAEISCNALNWANEDTEECKGTGTTIADADLLDEAIKKVTGGDNE